MRDGIKNGFLLPVDEATVPTGGEFDLREAAKSIARCSSVGIVGCSASVSGES